MSVDLPMVGLSALRAVVSASLFSLLYGCAGSVAPATAPSAPPENKEAPASGAAEKETEPVAVDGQLVFADGRSTEADKYLLEGEELLADEQWTAARTHFLRLDATAGALNARQRFRLWSGLALADDFLQDQRAALSWNDRALSVAATESERQLIVQRQLRLHLFLEEWAAAQRLAEDLSVEGLPPRDKVVIYTSVAMGQLESNELENARKNLARGRIVAESAKLHLFNPLPQELAALYYGRGEIERRASQSIELGELDTFLADLERRCVSILAAQGEYSQAMRANNAHWSAMAGVRVGELYASLHEELMAIPRPQNADTSERQALFEGAMRLRYSVLLKKAVAMMRATVAMVERTGEKTPWREKAEASLRDLEAAKAREEAAIEKLPYTRKQLQQVLDEMIAKAKAEG